MTGSARLVVSVMALLLAAVATVAAVGADEVELGSRYIDPANGFSLRPPKGTERRKQFSPSLLVSWRKRDAASGAIAWTLSVLKVPRAEKKLDLAAYAKTLAHRLRTKDGFDVEGAKVVSLAGTKAIDIRGVAGGKARLWKRQVWLPGGAKRFLVVQIAGPTGMKQTLAAVSEAVVRTLVLTDPKVAAARRKESLQRGTKLLASLTDERLAAAMGKGQWFLLRLGGKEVGFMFVDAQPATVAGVARRGYRVEMCWYLQHGKKKSVHVIFRKMLTTADRSYERWSEALYAGKTTGMPAAVEQGAMAGGMITCSITSGGKTTPRRQKPPMNYYLPRAMGFLLPQIVDLTSPAAYAFASYTSQTNRFDLRTLTVVGPEKITLADRRAETIRLTDQTAAHVEPATLWVTPAGKLLRMKTGEGLVMEPASPSAVTRRFAKAESIKKGLQNLSLK